MCITQTTRRGFTIIETLVAIAILMIAVAGPLSIASKGLGSALYAKDQMTASYLAQETMEILKNRRYNAADFETWVTSVQNCVAASSGRCNVDSTDSISSFITPSCNPLCALYTDSNGLYTSHSGSPTIYTRGFYVEKAVPPSGLVGQRCDTTDKECRIVVIVAWKTGAVSNRIDLYANLLK